MENILIELKLWKDKKKIRSSNTNEQMEQQ